MPTRVCPSCGAPDYGTPFCVSCQQPMVRDLKGFAASMISGEAELLPVERAGFFRRLAALAVDWLILSIISDILRFAYSFASGSETSHASLDISMAFSSIVFLLYFTMMTGDGGQTVGKMILGIRVERSDGSKIGYPRAFLRTIGYFVSAFFGTFLGFWWALWDRKNQTWHDKIAGTEVVKN